MWKVVNIINGHHELGEQKVSLQSVMGTGKIGGSAAAQLARQPHSSLGSRTARLAAASAAA